MKKITNNSPFFNMLSSKICILAVIITIFSCKKFVDIDGPSTNINSANVFKSDATAAAVLTGIYTKMSQSLYGGLNAVTLFTGLSSDELLLFEGRSNSLQQYLPYYSNDLNNQNTGGSDFSANIYPLIFDLNVAIEELDKTSSLSPLVKTHLKGEARFMRAFCYFYLVNLYGDVPLVLSSDYSKNANLSKSLTSKVYEQIILDLKDAQGLLSENYLAADAITISKDRVRPNKWAASALLSRVYIYIKDYTNANLQASNIISNISLFDTVSVNNVFLKNSKESIWQLYPTLDNSESNTQEARLFILPSSGPTNGGINPVYLNEKLVHSFDSKDRRRQNWINSVIVTVLEASQTMPAVTKTFYYPFKYKVSDINASVSEYSTVLRLGEQFLIRAESRLNIGDLNGALADLNVIRRRAGLANIPNLSSLAILSEIQKERQHEFFAEWGHRWFDMKRYGVIDDIMPTIAIDKEGTWEPKDKLYPFRLFELQRDPNLVQNPGY